MSAQNSTPEPIPVASGSTGLISIERVVAFVLGPIVVAASGTISAAAIKWGFNVTPKMVEGAFITGGLTAGAAVWKWLQGRQKTPILLNDGRHVLNTVEGVVEDLGVSHVQQESIERQVLGVLEEHAHQVANFIAQKVQMAGAEIHVVQPGPSAGKTTSAPSSAEVSSQTVESPAAQPEPPIEPAAGDPAPATPVETPPVAAPPVPAPPTAPVAQPETPPAGAGG